MLKVESFVYRTEIVVLCLIQEARQREVERLKQIIDAEKERAQEQKMMKRLNRLQEGGHDVTQLKAHYEGMYNISHF